MAPEKAKQTATSGRRKQGCAMLIQPPSSALSTLTWMRVPADSRCRPWPRVCCPLWAISTIGIRKFSAEAGFNPDAVEQTRVRMTIQAGFLSVLDDIKESDRNEMEKLMNEQILESARYPEIQFEGTAVSIHRLGDSLYSADLGGNLSLHGVVRPQLVTVRITLSDGMLRASGTFSILQSEFQIKPISLAGGMLKLKDELKCSFEMIAQKQD